MTMETGAAIGCINAGGRGTRLNELFTPDPKTGIAKALLEIGDPKTTLIDHHIANLRQQNIDRIVVVAGDQPQVYQYIRDTYGDDKDLCVIRSQGQFDTGGNLVNYARASEATDPFIIQNVDTILEIDFELFYRQFRHRRRLGAQACIALTLNKGVPNENAYLVGANGKVIYSAEFDDVAHAAQTQSGNSGEPLHYRASSTGAVVIDPEFLRRQNWQTSDGQLSLYRQTLSHAGEANCLYTYNNGYKFFRDVGTVATWLESDGDEKLQSQLRYKI